MLVLSRNTRERINVGDDIKITVTEIADKKVTLTVSGSVDKTITLCLGKSATLTDDIMITARSIKNQVKLGIDAPDTVRVEREHVD
jgi:sRNA-binding carbon storage regulator CsrA